MDVEVLDTVLCDFSYVGGYAPAREDSHALIALFDAANRGVVLTDDSVRGKLNLTEFNPNTCHNLTRNFNSRLGEK